VTLVSCPKAKAADYSTFVDQEREWGEQNGLETHVVSTVKPADRGWGSVRIDLPWTSRKLEFLGSGGSMVARTKLKGIDGRAHKKWNLRLSETGATWFRRRY